MLNVIGLFVEKYLDMLLQYDCSQNGRRGVFETAEEMVVHCALCWRDKTLKCSKMSPVKP